MAQSKIVINAPAPVCARPSGLPLSRVLSVEVEKGEQVEWTWTHLPGGVSYVSGYSVTPGAARQSRTRRSLKSTKKKSVRGKDRR
jgi:hypothetical protein